MVSDNSTIAIKVLVSSSLVIIVYILLLLATYPMVRSAILGKGTNVSGTFTVIEKKKNDSGSVSLILENESGRYMINSHKLDAIERVAGDSVVCSFTYYERKQAPESNFTVTSVNATGGK